MVFFIFLQLNMLGLSAYMADNKWITNIVRALFD